MINWSKHFVVVADIGTNPDLSFFQPPAVDGTLGDPKAASKHHIRGDIKKFWA